MPTGVSITPSPFESRIATSSGESPLSLMSRIPSPSASRSRLSLMPSPSVSPLFKAVDCSAKSEIPSLSSSRSMSSGIPSPSVSTEQTLGPEPKITGLQENPLSIAQTAEQPSPSTVLPSSQPSRVSTTPSPQDAPPPKVPTSLGFSVLSGIPSPSLSVGSSIRPLSSVSRPPNGELSISLFVPSLEILR